MANNSLRSNCAEQLTSPTSLFNYMRKKPDAPDMRKNMKFWDLNDLREQAIELQKQLHYARHTIGELENLSRKLKQNPSVLLNASDVPIQRPIVANEKPKPKKSPKTKHWR